MRRVNRNIYSLKTIEDPLANIIISYQTRTHLNSNKSSLFKHHVQNISSNGDLNATRFAPQFLHYGDVEKYASYLFLNIPTVRYLDFCLHAFPWPRKLNDYPRSVFCAECNSILAVSVKFLAISIMPGIALERIALI